VEHAARPIALAHRLAVLAAILVAVASPLFGTGCAAPPSPAPLSAPPLAVGWDHHAGPALAGARADASVDDRDLAAAVPVRGRVVFVEALPANGLVPLAARARLLSATAARPIRGVLERGVAVHAAVGEAALGFVTELDAGRLGRHVDVARLDGALADGTTLALTVAGRDRASSARVALPLSRAADSVTAAFVVTERSATDAVAAREVALLEPLALAATTVVFAFPATLVGGSTGAVVGVLEVGSGPVDPEVLEALVSGIAAAAEAAARATAALTEDGARLRSLTTAFGTLGATHANRRALVFLADAARAPLALDLALSADGAFLMDWLARVAAAAAPDDIGWSLERSAYELLADRLRDASLAPELAGILLRHTGSAGRSAAALADALAACPGAAVLTDRLEHENRIDLADPDPGVRVRAFDWLAARRGAPTGYDPLARATERRAALERDLAARGVAK
jgi:hypothetical protein